MMTGQLHLAFDKSYNHGANRIEDSEDVEEIKGLNDLAFENSSSTEGASTSPVNALVDQTSIHKDSNEIEPVSRLSKSTELSSAICWTDFSLTRGVLPCGHRFCFPCIRSWVDHMSASRKISTCPLCKASFVSITKVADAVSSDQKIYSQTIPHDPSVDIYILPNGEALTFRAPEPEDLLIICHFCQIRCVHSYCLDPYMLPWTCVHCKDLRRLYHHTHPLVCFY